MWRIMKSKSRRRDDSNFILQSYCAFFFHFSPSFCWVFLAYSDLHRHYDFKIKLPKLQKKKKNHFMFLPSIHLSAETTRFRWYGWFGQYFFRYETWGVPVSVHWPAQYIPVVSAGTAPNWLPCFLIFI